MFLEPGSELLVVDDGASLSSVLARLDETTARAMGLAAQRAVLARHTYEHRSALLESTISALPKGPSASTERHLAR